MEYNIRSSQTHQQYASGVEPRISSWKTIMQQQQQQQQQPHRPVSQSTHQQQPFDDNKQRYGNQYNQRTSIPPSQPETLINPRVSSSLGMSRNASSSIATNAFSRTSITAPVLENGPSSCELKARMVSLKEIHKLHHKINTAGDSDPISLMMEARLFESHKVPMGNKIGSILSMVGGERNSAGSFGTGRASWGTGRSSVDGVFLDGDRALDVNSGNDRRAPESMFQDAQSMHGFGPLRIIRTMLALFAPSLRDNKSISDKASSEPEFLDPTVALFATHRVSWHYHDSHLVVVGDDGALYLMQLDARCVWQRPSLRSDAHGKSVSVAMRPFAMNSFASGYDSGWLGLWTNREFVPLHMSPALHHRQPVIALSWNKAGDILASMSSSCMGSIIIWNVSERRGEALRSIEPVWTSIIKHTQIWMQEAWRNMTLGNGKQTALNLARNWIGFQKSDNSSSLSNTSCAARGHYLRLWNTDGWGNELIEFRINKTESIQTLAWSPSGKTLLLAANSKLFVLQVPVVVSRAAAYSKGSYFAQGSSFLRVFGELLFPRKTVDIYPKVVHVESTAVCCVPREQRLTSGFAHGQLYPQDEIVPGADRSREINRRSMDSLAQYSRIGGNPRLVAWDGLGERVAVAFSEGSESELLDLHHNCDMFANCRSLPESAVLDESQELICVYAVRESPNFGMMPLSIIRGPTSPSSKKVVPLSMEFRPVAQADGSLLAILWSNMELQLIPFIYQKSSS